MKSPLSPGNQASLRTQKSAGKALKPRLIEQLISGLDSKTARIKYGCAKALRLLSEQHPEWLYPHFDCFVRLLDHPNRIFQWQGALVLAGLAGVDKENKLDALLAKYFSPIRGPVMITAANVIKGSARIALAKPSLADRVATEILKVETARYQTLECRNIAAGHAILALGEIFHLVTDQAPALRFVRKQLKNSRPATRQKAEAFLNRAGRDS